jgi:hypothetical protein
MQSISDIHSGMTLEALEAEKQERDLEVMRLRGEMLQIKTLQSPKEHQIMLDAKALATAPAQGISMEGKG